MRRQHAHATPAQAAWYRENALIVARSGYQLAGYLDISTATMCRRLKGVHPVTREQCLALIGLASMTGKYLPLLPQGETE